MLKNSLQDEITRSERTNRLASFSATHEVHGMNISARDFPQQLKHMHQVISPDILTAAQHAQYQETNQETQPANRHQCLLMSLFTLFCEDE